MIFDRQLGQCLSRTGLDLCLIPGKVRVLALMAESPGELVHHFLEDDAVDVLAEHVEQEPVAHLALLYNGVDHFALDQAETDVKQISPHPRAQNDDGTVEDNLGIKKNKSGLKLNKKLMILNLPMLTKLLE